MGGERCCADILRELPVADGQAPEHSPTGPRKGILGGILGGILTPLFDTTTAPE
jgi:hypothetical protein